MQNPNEVTEVNPVLTLWDEYGAILSFAVFGVGVGIVLYHFLRLTMTKELKSRYDYISKYEINTLWNACLLVIIALGLFVNTLLAEAELHWFIVRLFVTAMLGLIIGVVVSNILKFYYPFYVEKRLKKLRYTPRISPKTGKPMKLLSEEEEDVYLDEGMQAEEEVFSVDYDVWIDEETGYTKIEKYSGHLHALQCPECNYQTLKVSREEIIESPTASKEGELMKFYTCTYCGYKAKKSFKIAKLKETGPVQSEKPVVS
ncbi:MAG TPA: hypothetical protein DCE41_36555 [Cytophagales bacterium]|nr:hypothetical protein [Cytophagales bacterium]HAA18365.1 hypothetical protein [Cytophagales bacterium]HAP60349.1 hypothetical protein [Cytophagales bacterium]